MPLCLEVGLQAEALRTAGVNEESGTQGADLVGHDVLSRNELVHQARLEDGGLGGTPAKRRRNLTNVHVDAEHDEALGCVVVLVLRAQTCEQERELNLCTCEKSGRW